MTQLTVEQFKAALPTQFRKNVSQDLIDNVNTVLKDPEMYEAYRDNLIGYTHVLKDGKFKISSYLDAVRYVSFKLMNCTNIEAYSKTFPDKIARFKAQKVAPKDVASYCTAYHKSKLVGLLLAQTLTPSWVLNQDLHQQALNTQAYLMNNARSEKVRSDAANSLLTHLKQPESQKIELDIGVKEDSSIAALRSSTLELVAQQKAMLSSGAMHAQEVAHSKLITNAAYEEVDDVPRESTGKRA